jgi:hypothetical protein
MVSLWHCTICDAEMWSCLLMLTISTSIGALPCNWICGMMNKLNEMKCDWKPLFICIEYFANYLSDSSWTTSNHWLTMPKIQDQFHSHLAIIDLYWILSNNYESGLVWLILGATLLQSLNKLYFWCTLTDFDETRYTEYLLYNYYYMQVLLTFSHLEKGLKKYFEFFDKFWCKSTYYHIFVRVLSHTSLI